ncbi:hypothetical protein HRG_011337 [Hirsutella rhossiliensis]|uniref:Uncharacterized protein n=1 Tax=Hirsutella rhossiliensis TaxID=111463 RepID=A0A9P8MM24_9HYPO|nr:uncharacterized protein HRG_11337 [Hirsutella rhossiliensis]KAH0957555.1 hypothetical protein HRG_11337 [Hirsutella rhossiliensis]
MFWQSPGDDGAGRDAERVDAVDIDDKDWCSGHGGQPAEASAWLTCHQVFYMLVLGGLGGMAISGSINFALAYAMYTTQDTTKAPIRLFQFPNTLAGDAAVTIIVQCIITWFIEAALVAHDLAHRAVQPIGWAGREPKHHLLRALFLLPPDHKAAPVARVRLFRLGPLIQHLLRALLVAVVAFVPLWPAAVGLLTVVGERDSGDWWYQGRWTPQVFKLILGGALSLLTTPLMAMFWLVRAGWVASHHASSDL